MVQFVFNSASRKNYQEIAKCLSLICGKEKPIIICVGSDIAVGDSLGPFVGTKLIENLNNDFFVYGSLKNPITAKEVKTVSRKIKLIHPNSKIIVVDAALGKKSEIGYVKVLDRGIKPGLGVKKNLPLIGDVSIIAIVGEYSGKNYILTGKERFNLIYTMGIDIANGITLAFNK